MRQLLFTNKKISKIGGQQYIELPAALEIDSKSADVVYFEGVLKVIFK